MPTTQETFRPQSPPPGATDPAADPAPDSAPDPGASLKSAAGNLNELGAYALQYASVQFDRTLALVRNLALLVLLLVVAGIVGLSVLVTSATLLVIGLAQGLTALLSNQPGVGAGWHGNLIVGAVLCALSLIGVWLLTKWIKSSGFAATVRKYDAMKQAQKQSLGHTAEERAQEKRHDRS